MQQLARGMVNFTFISMAIWPYLATVCHMSGVTCQVSGVTCHFFFLFFFDKLVDLVGGGSVINGAYPNYFQCIISKYVHFKNTSLTLGLYYP